MNILLTTYPEAFVNPGGGEIELINLASQLTSIPILNQIYSYTTHGVRSYSHFIHFSVVPSGINLIKNIFDSSNPDSKKYLWPLFWPSEDSAHNSDYIDMFDGVIFKSKFEFELFKAAVKKNFKGIIINDFIDKKYLKKNEHLRGIFSEIFNLNYKKFNLWVGVVEKQKQQLEFIEKIKNSNETYVFIGGSSDLNYLNQCKEIGQKNCIFLDYLEQGSDLLVSAYLDCKAYFEFPKTIGGTSVIEALSQGCEVNIFDGPWANELAERFAIKKSKNSSYSDLFDSEVVILKLEEISEDIVSTYSIEKQVKKLIQLIN